MPVVGRPSEFTPDVAEAIIAHVTRGNYLSTAALAAGISPRTLRRWRQRGNAGEQPFADFVQSLKRAEYMAETALVGLIRNAAEADPKHAEWLLAMRHPERWSRDRNQLKEVNKTVALLLEQLGVLQSEIQQLRDRPTRQTSRSG